MPALKDIFNHSLTGGAIAAGHNELGPQAPPGKFNHHLGSGKRGGKKLLG
jgi:hypothetical protein